MDKETLERIADYFDGHELAEYLKLSARDIIEAFPEEVEEALDDIEELMGVKCGDDC